jgi:hypothetical protein
MKFLNLFCDFSNIFTMKCAHDITIRHDNPQPTSLLSTYLRSIPLVVVPAKRPGAGAGWTMCMVAQQGLDHPIPLGGPTRPRQKKNKVHVATRVYVAAAACSRGMLS